LLESLATFPGSRNGKTETRGLHSDFAKNTYVPTSLETEIEDQIKRRQIQLVILCGNAGDGKTAFLQHLAQKLGLGQPQSSQRVWKGNAGGLNFMLNLDGAASFKNRSSDDLLDEIQKDPNHREFLALLTNIDLRDDHETLAAAISLTIPALRSLLARFTRFCKKFLAKYSS